MGLATRSLRRTMPGDGPVAPLLVSALELSKSLVIGPPVVPPCVTLAAVNPFAELVVMLGALTIGVAPPPVVAPPLVDPPPPVEAPPVVLMPDASLGMPAIGAPMVNPPDPVVPKVLWVGAAVEPVLAPADGEGELLRAVLITTSPNCSGVLSRLSNSIGSWSNWSG